MPKLKFTSPTGQTLEVDSPDGSTPSEGELDEMFSKAYPTAVPQQGMISKAWDWATNPLGKTYPLVKQIADADQAKILSGADRMGIGGIMRGISKVNPLSPLVGASEQTSPLDLASAAIPTGRLGMVLNLAASAGVTGQGLMNLRDAYNSGDWSKVPQGTLQLVLGGLGVASSGVGKKTAGVSDEIATGFSGARTATTLDVPSTAVGDAPLAFGPGAGSQSAGRPPAAPAVPAIAPQTGTGAVAPPPPPLQSAQWGVSRGTSSLGQSIPASQASVVEVAKSDLVRAQQMAKEADAALKAHTPALLENESRGIKKADEKVKELVKHRIAAIERAKKAERALVDAKIAEKKAQVTAAKAGEGRAGDYENDVNLVHQQFPDEGVPPVPKIGAASPNSTPSPTGSAATPPPPTPPAPPEPLFPNPPKPEMDDFSRAAQEADEAVSQLPPDVAERVGQLPAVPEGHTRVYRREGPLSREGGTWFSTNLAEAANYNDGVGTLKYVDVPTARLEAENLRLGRDAGLRGEFDFAGGMEGYAARAGEVPPMVAAKESGDTLTNQLQGSLDATKGIDEGILAPQGSPRLAAPKPEQPAILENFSDLSRSGEQGFFHPSIILDAAKAANRGVGDFLRASVAGDIPTALRNVQSGLRMVGQAMIENPLAAGHQKIIAARLRSQGKMKEAAEADRAAKFFMEAAKAFPRATFEEGAASLADGLQIVTGGKWRPAWGNPSAFGDRVKLMKDRGDVKLGDKLGDFSSAALTGDGAWRKGIMFFNIMGDRFINRTYLRSGVDAAQKVFGASSPQHLEQMAASNPTMAKVLQEFLVDTGSEAFRASWQNTAASGYTKTLIKALDETPLGLVVQPFAKAFFANMLPNIAEKIPGLAFGSKRVRNSFEYQSNKKLIELLGQNAQGNPAIQKQLSALKKTQVALQADGIYHPSKIYARMAMGPLVVAGAIYRRLQAGDDGTEFDQTPVELGSDGKATKVASFTSQAGEDLPFWYLGDRIAHQIIADREGRPSKYDGKAGVASLGPLMKSLYGSRYGVGNPAFDLIGAIAGGKQELDAAFLDRTVRSISEDLGRMAGAGSWLGGTARRVAAAHDPEEAKIRRGDVTESRGPLARVKESFAEGFQTQIPKNAFGIPDRTSLPESLSWSKGRAASTPDPMEPLTGGSREDYDKLVAAGKPVSALLSLIPGSSRFEVSRLDRFANEHQGKVSLAQILPRRTQQPAYDKLVLAHLTEGLQKRAIPALEAGKIDKLSPDSQVEWFQSLASIREDAKKKASREFKKLTGEWPAGVLDKKDQKKEKRLEKRSMKKELRQVGY
jgi:hypothetical protein